MTDPDTAGAQFLRNDAEGGTAFVRAPPDRTLELEAIFPEGSEFARTGQLGVNLPNNEVPTLDVFNRRTPDTATDVDADAPDCMHTA